MARPDGVVALPIPTSSAAVAKAPKQGRVHGWSGEETGGAAQVRIRFHDGADASGPLIGVFTVALGATTPPLLSNAGIIYQNGLFAEVTSAGVIDGVVYVG